MARKSISSLINIPIEQFNKLKKDELIKIVNQMHRYSVKRIKNLENRNIYSPALQGYSGFGDIHHYNAFKDVLEYNTYMNNMTLQQVRAEYRRERNFLKAETSTIKGYKKYKTNIIKKMKKEGIEIEDEQFDEFFRTYERLKELDPSVSEYVFKYNILKTIETYMEDGNRDMEKLIYQMYGELDKIYEDNAKIDDVSDFFIIDNDEEEK